MGATTAAVCDLTSLVKVGPPNRDSDERFCFVGVDFAEPPKRDDEEEDDEDDPFVIAVTREPNRELSPKRDDAPLASLPVEAAGGPNRELLDGHVDAEGSKATSVSPMHPAL